MSSLILRAKSIDAVACEHGSVYVRLWDVDGHIFAVGIVDRTTGLKLAEQILDQVANGGSVTCEGSHQ